MKERIFPDEQWTEYACTQTVAALESQYLAMLECNLAYCIAYRSEQWEIDEVKAQIEAEKKRTGRKE